MEGFFIQYRDPLFGIFLFFILLFFISFISYITKIIQNTKEKMETKHFLSSFNTQFSQIIDLKNVLKDISSSFESLMILASSYTKVGEYENAIKTYHAILEIYSDKLDSSDRANILGELGIIYFKAGFLQRSKNFFLESLKLKPINIELLKYLTTLHEKIGDYKKAIEVLEVLNELGCDIEKENIYFEAMQTISNDKPSIADIKLKELYEKNEHLDRIYLDFLIQNGFVIDILIVENMRFEKIMDLLWSLDIDRIAIDSFTKNQFLELFSARGVIKKDSDNEILEFDIFKKLSYTTHKADIGFEYICDNYKNIHPFYMHRCPNCLSLDTIFCEPIIIKKDKESYY